MRGLVVWMYMEFILPVNLDLGSWEEIYQNFYKSWYRDQREYKVDFMIYPDILSYGKDTLQEIGSRTKSKWKGGYENMITVVAISRKIYNFREDLRTYIVWHFQRYEFKGTFNKQNVKLCAYTFKQLCL